MVNALVESHIEKAVMDAMGDSAVKALKGVSKLAAKQGGQSTLENYQLLGKRALVGIGVAIVVVNVATTVCGFIISRNSEEKRVERIVRRVLAEERAGEQEEAVKYVAVD